MTILQNKAKNNPISQVQASHREYVIKCLVYLFEYAPTKPAYCRISQDFPSHSPRSIDSDKPIAHQTSPYSSAALVHFHANGKSKQAG
jgi:hypothetical protein